MRRYTSFVICVPMARAYALERDSETAFPIILPMVLKFVDSTSSVSSYVLGTIWSGALSRREIAGKWYSACSIRI